MGGEVAVCLRRSLYKISCVGIDDDNITRALILYVERGRALEARPKLPHNSICMPFKGWRRYGGTSEGLGHVSVAS